MDAEELKIYLNDLFNRLVDEFVPQEEVYFKAYAKNTLNPILASNSENQMVNAQKIISKNLANVNQPIDFIGANTDELSQRNYLLWSWQIPNLFISEMKKEFEVMLGQGDSKILKNELNTYFKELEFQTPHYLIDGLKKVRDYIIEDTITPVNSKKEPSYYFELKANQIQHLYKLLLENNLIEENEHFLASFEINNNFKKYNTTWTGMQKSAYYLLYLLNNKNETFNNLDISKIYQVLFKRKDINTETNLASSYSRFKKAIYTNDPKTRFKPVIDLFFSKYPNFN